MKNVLIVSGHTDLNGSVANKVVIDELKQAFPEAELSILNELYPDFNIDVQAEQEKLLKADVIVWQFPVFWYSMPSLLRRWIEQVYTHGFAYGSTGEKLKGKKLFVSFTLGAPEAAYSREGVGYTIDEIIGSQIKSIAALCQLDLQEAIYTAGVNSALSGDPSVLENIKMLSNNQALRLIEAIKA